jgi:hypothetical protein
MPAHLVLAVAAAIVHPLHTTMTELTIDPSRHAVRAVVRAFADDFGTASKGTTPETFVAARVKIADASGKRLDLRGCGVRRTGDLLWICVEGAYSGAERDLRLANSLLCDLFDDQVNIVQVTRTGSPARRSLLFTHGDGAKVLLP